MAALVGRQKCSLLVALWSLCITFSLFLFEARVVYAGNYGMQGGGVVEEWKNFVEKKVRERTIFLMHATQQILHATADSIQNLPVSESCEGERGAK
eukprot:TRINITY_DN6422_c0_g1_i1.p1 TRINITY_DN6422_c0_g1~~TRINITY_DN6422_c0_g1_i1.p1  ORF type:complete len:103 (+),score=10.71 TRINITY_DN6422_c0_g1_i1:23-310(+)